MFTNLPELITPLNNVIDKMDHLNKEVHQIVIESDFMSKNSRNIEAVINHMQETKGLEVLDKAFVGMLQHKLPKLPLAQFNVFQKHKGQIIFAVILTQFLIEEGILRIREEVKRSRDEETGKATFARERYIVFDAEIADKNIADGIEFTPGVLRDKGIKVKVGAKEIKYGKQQKDLVRALASQKFVVSSYCYEELLLKGYSLGKGYSLAINGMTNEHPLATKARFAKYADAVSKIQNIGEFHLTNWFDSRNRMYYHANLEGMRPQGKLWETLMIDSATPYTIDESGYKHLIHILMVTLEGRMTITEAHDRFTDAHLIEAEAIDPMKQDNLEDFGEAILLNKLAMAHEQYMRAEPCYFIFGKDLTNSGVGIAGNAFRSAKMMNAGNYGGTDEAVDSHKAFAIGYGLERSVIKSAHTGLLHGSTFNSMADMLRDAIVQPQVKAHIEKHGLFVSKEAERVFTKQLVANGEGLDYLTTDYVAKGAIASYGSEVLNIDSIASWGGNILTNEDTTLLWTSRDGWKAQSTSYMEKVPLTLYSVSRRAKAGYSTWSLLADMPIILAKNKPIFGKEEGVTVKKRGLFANLTHSIDSALLRAVMQYSLDNGYTGMYKHDDYMLPLNAFDGVIEVIQDFMEDVRENCPFTSAMNEIAQNHSRNIKPPKLLVGNAENTIKSSINMIMP